MKCLQKNSCVTLTGPSGVGKSFIARHAALILQKEGYRIISVDSPKDIRKYYQPDLHTVFIVDDICGNFTANQQQIEKWKRLLPVIRNIIENNYCKIIVSCRLQVYKDDKFNLLSLFKSCECNLISNELCLTSVEKRDIADMYIGIHSKNLSEEAKRCEFFPFLCSLYHKQKEDKTDLNEFFENPFNFYKTQLDNLARFGDEGKYKVCSLALCVLFNNTLTEEWFQGKVTDQQRPLIEETCDACRLNRCTSKVELKEALNTLEGTFIFKKKGIYRTLHDKLFDFLAHYFGQNMIECFIDHGDKDLIEERFVWQKSSYNKNRNTEFIIEITDHYLEAYLQRLIMDWSKGTVKFVFDKKDMKVSSFRQRLLQYLRTLDKSKQITLINTKNTWEQVYSFVRGSFCINDDYPLIRACKHGYIDIVEWILNNDVDVNQCRDDGVSGMYMANQEGHTTIVNMLLKKNANVDLCNRDGESLLYKACQTGRINIVKMLLERNPNVDLCDNNDCSPLLQASQHGHTYIVNLLLARNSNAESCDNMGYTPLIKSCINNNKTTVQILLQHKPDINAKTTVGSTALYFSALLGNIEITQLLLVNKADCNICTYSKDYFGDKYELLKVLKRNALHILMTNAPPNLPVNFVKKLRYHDEEDTINSDKRRYNDEQEKCAFEVFAGSSPLHIACFMGRTNVVRCLLEHKANIDMTKEDGTTPLSYACELGYTDIVKMLLDQNANIDICDNDGFTPLIKACLNNNISTVQLLIKYKPDINARTVDGGSALFFSALNGNLEITQLLLENSADYHICFNNKDTFNNQASLNLKQHKIFNILVNYTSTNVAAYVRKKSENTLLIHSCDYNASYPCEYSKAEYYALNTFAGSSPLHIACFMGGTNVVSCLLEHGSNINMTKEDGITPLYYACEVGQTEIVKILLDQNANIDSCDNDGFTPLIKSCLNDHTSTIKLLIKYKPDINARTVDGTNALFFSSLNGNLEISKLLLENNADCNNCIHSKQLIIESLGGHPNERVYQKELYFFDILVNGTSEYIKEYVEVKPLNYAFHIFAGSSSLHIACFMGRLDVVQCLLKKKANINKANDYGTTPLSYACELGHTDILKLLLDKYAILDSFDNDGFTPLMISCLNSNISAVKLLIKHKLDINAQTCDGRSALFFSALNGNLEITKLLLENSADCNICFHCKNRMINTLNNHAMLNKKKREIFESLITSTSKKTADYLRGKYLNYESLKELRIHYGNRKSVDYTFDVVAGSSPLHIACYMGRTDVVRCLLDHNANINMAKEDGTTPLSYACEVGHTDIVKMLLDKSAKVDLCDNDGFTPLIKSCLNNNISTVQLLIKHKPNINARALNGLHALIFSALNGNLEITQILLKNSADCNICCDSKECVKETSTKITKKTLKQIKQYIFNVVNNLSSIANDYLPAKSTRRFNYDIDWSAYYNPLEEVNDNEEAIDHVFDVVADSSPLHIACLIGATNVVRCLLDHNANINMTKEDGTTPLFYACKKGHTDIVRMLLEKNANVNIYDNCGFTPLTASCLNNNTSIVQLLINHKPNINARTVDGANGLFFSALYGNQDITKILLQNNADCNISIYSKERMICTFKDNAKKSFEQEKQDIFDIFRFNSSSNLRQHVIKKSLYQFWTKSLDYVSIRKKAVDYVFDVVAGSSPLHIACFMGRTDVVRCLLDHNANVNMTKEDGTTPLQYACGVGHTDIVKMLLTDNANVDLCDNDGFTPLIKACMNNNTSVVQLLIQHKSDINARALYGLNALFFSAMNGNLELVQLLLKSSADCNICFDSKDYIKDALTNHTNKTLKHKKQYIFDIVNKLLSIANDYDIDSDRVFGYGNEESLHHDNEESVDGEKFIDPVFDVVTSSTPLLIACCMQRKDGVHCLLEHTASIDMANEDGETSLFNACVKGHTDIVKLLLEEKANVNKCKNNGVSPLSIASKLGHDDIVRMLLEKNADVDLCDNKGFSPLLIASQAERNDIVKLLLQKNPNVDLFETIGLTTALWCSCFDNNSSILKLLIKHKPDINAQVIDGSCALFLSSLNGNVDIVQLLLDNNADCNICCHSKQSLIDKIISKRTFDNITRNIYVSYLKKASSTNGLDYVSKKMSTSKEYAFDVVAGSSPLHIACYNGWIKVVSCLLKHKANINMAKEDGTTPLFYACELGHEDIVQLLLDNRADTQICRVDGKSPFNIATDNAHESVVIMLRKYIEDQHTISS
ncbi:protein phosphatase 1 regulatory subunit 16A [Mytilus galloprovincialis]|uniref:Protein phosphatase 1 regulatory subunit 16A n=1 Tax=Mytilus galloprovincialis TaxID=29158 RepID=A0A8B6BNL3_MYTGA|nr:protein phosphatase 1 regulatory subunit 16A [Mytilus galloprovincialis]